MGELPGAEPDVRPVLRTIVAALAALVAVLPQAAPAVPPADAAARAASWLASRARPDGSFGGNAGAALEAAASVALVRGAADPAVQRTMRFARAHGLDAVRGGGAGNAGKIVLALIALGQDPRAFGGVDYVKLIEDSYDAVTGAYDTRNGYADSLAVLGLIAAGIEPPSHAFDRIEMYGCRSGAYASDVGCVRDDASADTTAMIIHVFMSARGSLVPSTIARLRAMQNDDGGFGRNVSAPESDANSTGLVLSAMSRMHVAATSWTRSGRDALDAVRALQTASGGFRISRGSTEPDLFATVQALPRLLLASYPLHAAVTGTAARPDVVTASSSPTAPSAGPCDGRGGNRANLVIVFGDGSLTARCVRFAEKTITGIELLERSGVGVVVKEFGGGNVFVCSIAGRGRDYPRESCTPPCPDPDACVYWGYYQRVAGVWRFSNVGPSARVIRDGETDGWRWGLQSTAGGCPPDPKLMTCARAAPPIASSARASATTPAQPKRPTGAALLLLVFAGLATLGAHGFRARAGADR
ncbi:MAG: prenyltransferase/squalene oxidase repeat-containing protein [Actinomycetota bacterium]